MSQMNAKDKYRYIASRALITFVVLSLLKVIEDLISSQPINNLLIRTIAYCIIGLIVGYVMWSNQVRRHKNAEWEERRERSETESNNS